MIVWSVYHNNTLLVQCSDIYLANKFFNQYIKLLNSIGRSFEGVRMQSDTIWTVSSELDIDECMDFIKGITKKRPKTYHGDRIVEYLDPK